MELHHANWDELPWKHVREGVDRKAFYGTGGTIAMNRLMPGHESRPHNHVHEQMVHIVSGQIDSYVEHQVHRLGPGGMVGDQPVINLDVFTPRRTEYA
jgi:uncharacterized cupin superfamily protein